MHGLPYYQHPSTEFYICCNQWTYIWYYHYHPKFIVYIRVHSGANSVGLKKCVMIHIHHFSDIQKNFITWEVHTAVPVHPFSILPGNNWSFHCLSSFSFPKCPVIGTIQCIVLSEWLFFFSLGKYAFKFPPCLFRAWLLVSF